MDDPRRVAIGLAGLAVVAALATVLWWRSETNRHDAMQATVTSFEPPAAWVDWTPLITTSRGFNPFCIDVRCPSYSERHIVAIPEGDRKAEVVAALQALDVGKVDAPSRSCATNSRCYFTIDGENFDLGVVVNEPFDHERGTLLEIPAGFVEAAVQISAS